MVFDSEWYVTNMMEDTVGYSGNFELNNSTLLRHVRCFFLLLSDFFYEYRPMLNMTSVISSIWCEFAASDVQFVNYANI